MEPLRGLALLTVYNPSLSDVVTYSGDAFLGIASAYNIIISLQSMLSIVFGQITYFCNILLFYLLMRYVHR